MPSQPSAHACLKMAQSGEAQKYAKTMLTLLTGRRTDLLAMKKKWLRAA